MTQVLRGMDLTLQRRMICSALSLLADTDFPANIISFEHFNVLK